MFFSFLLWHMYLAHYMMLNEQYALLLPQNQKILLLFVWEMIQINKWITKREHLEQNAWLTSIFFFFFWIWFMLLLSIQREKMMSKWWLWNKNKTNILFMITKLLYYKGNISHYCFDWYYVFFKKPIVSKFYIRYQYKISKDKS